MADIIRIIIGESDVKSLAEELGVDETLALARANEWGKHIEGTASNLVAEQLSSCIAFNQP